MNILFVCLDIMDAALTAPTDLLVKVNIPTIWVDNEGLKMKVYSDYQGIT